jgi:hypothetical protein
MEVGPFHHLQLPPLPARGKMDVWLESRFRQLIANQEIAHHEYFQAG